MPTYVYECSLCNNVFEVEQRITEDALKDCPCGSKGTVKRLIQPTAIMFKGSGFYVNDSQKATNPAVAPTEKAAPSTESTSAAPAPPVATQTKSTE
ncbi:MAG: FmdB family zinc ribbon protein [Armatimonadota bacterium]